MSRLFAIIPSTRRWKLALLLGAFVGALAATGFGAYAAASGGNTINACANKATGMLRVSSNGTCLPSEQALQWNQTGPPGPPGPPGNTDSTVRHISNFIVDGSSVTTPILSAKGELGKPASASTRPRFRVPRCWWSRIRRPRSLGLPRQTA